MVGGGGGRGVPCVIRTLSKGKLCHLNSDKIGHRESLN